MGYIDELVQTVINANPIDDPECDPNDADHRVRRYYALHDANYNVMGIVDEEGTLIERYEYTPYGERTVYFSAGANDPDCYSPTVMSRRVEISGVPGAYGLNDMGFQGKAHDESIGIINYNNRVYLPTVGIFPQRDPSGYPDGINAYAAHHVLLNRVDPSGKKTVSINFVYYTTGDDISERTKAFVQNVLWDCLGRCMCKDENGRFKHRVLLRWYKSHNKNYYDLAMENNAGHHTREKMLEQPKFFNYAIADDNWIVNINDLHAFRGGYNQGFEVTYNPGQVRQDSPNYDTGVGTVIAHEGFHHVIRGEPGHFYDTGYIDAAWGPGIAATAKNTLSDKSCNSLCKKLEIDK